MTTDRPEPDPLEDAAEGDFVEQRTDAAGGRPELPVQPDESGPPMDADEADLREQETDA